MPRSRKLSGSASVRDTLTPKRTFLGGAVIWSVAAIAGFGMRLGGPLRVGELRLLYYLGGTGSVDSYLVGGARIRLFLLHLVIAALTGGSLALLLGRLLPLPQRTRLWIGLICLSLAGVFQALFFVPIRG